MNFRRKPVRLFTKASVAVTFNVRRRMVSAPFVVNDLFGVTDYYGLGYFSRQMAALLRNVTVFQYFVSIRLRMVRSRGYHYFRRLFRKDISGGASLFW